jgi:ribosomal protein S18 acetylase RimI-like enzyme
LARRVTGSPFRWRAMAAADLAAVSHIASAVHPDFPEDEAVFAERLALHPPGCLVLAGPEELAGYVVSHPWGGACPPLNSLLGAIPADASTYYLHDLALLPAARGTGAASAAIEQLRAHAEQLGLTQLSLVAVNHSGGFWRRQGFAETPASEGKLASYGDEALLMVRTIA